MFRMGLRYLCSVTEIEMEYCFPVPLCTADTSSNRRAGPSGEDSDTPDGTPGDSSRSTGANPFADTHYRAFCVLRSTLANPLHTQTGMRNRWAKHVDRFLHDD